MTLWPVPRALFLWSMVLYTAKPVWSDSPSTQSSSQGQEIISLIPVQLDIKSKKSNDMYEYYLGSSEKIASYQANQGYGFSKVKKRGGSCSWLKTCLCWTFSSCVSDCCKTDCYYVDIWSATDSTKLANHVVINGIGSKERTLTITLADNSVTKVFQEKDGKWTEVESTKATKSSTPYSVSLVSSSEVSSNQIIPKKVVLPEQNLSAINSSLPKFKVVTEGSKEPNDTNKYYLKASTDLITYKFKYDSKCTELKYENKTIWKYDPAKANKGYPTYIFIHINSKIIYLKLGDSLFTCSLDDQQSYCSEVKPVQLDISKKESTSEFEFYKKDNIGTYTAKDNVVFNEVIRKKARCNCGSDFTFLEAKDPGQYVYKVVRDDTDSTKSITKVKLHLVNGRVLTLTKENDYSYNRKPWIPFGPPELTIITEGSDVPNDYTQYDIFSDHDIFDYIFGEKTKCTQIILKDELLWEHEDHKPYPKSFIYYRNETRLLVSFDLENIVFRKQEDKWYKTTSILGIIDINCRESTNRFKYTRLENSSIGSFEAKPGHGFSKIIQKSRLGSDKVVWEVEGIREHSVKLMLDGLGTGESTQEVKVYIANGDTLIYTKTGGCCRKQWTLLRTELHTSQQI